jgi:hypothetical protein
VLALPGAAICWPQMVANFPDLIADRNMTYVLLMNNLDALCNTGHQQ